MISCHILHIAKEKMFSKASTPTEFFESFFFLFFFFNQDDKSNEASWTIFNPSQLAASPKVKEKKKNTQQA